MSANKPKHIKNLFENIDKKHNLLQNNIPEQCGKNADPLYQDFRFGTICDPLDEFIKRGLTKEKLHELKNILPIIYPWDVEYDILRQNVNRRFVVFPWAIIMCTKKRHVIESYKLCLKYNIPLCLRAGAHCYEPYSLCDGIVIDQSRRTKVKVNQEKQTVKVDAGCLNGPVADILSKYGFALTQGTCANVGITGLALGGGLGFTGRQFGLTCDNILNFELLLPNGKLLLVDKENYPDLFWAHQGGGGGNFGIVLSFTFKVHSVSDVIVFELWWNFDKLLEILNKWLEWGPTSDRRITTELDIYCLNKNRLSKYPVLITGIFIGNSRKDLKDLLKPILDLEPLKINLNVTTYLDSARHFTYQKFPPPFFKNKSTFIYKKINKEFVETVYKYMKKAGPNDRLEFNGLGGAYADKKNNDTAYVHRDALAWMQILAKWGSNLDNHFHKINKENISAWEDYIMEPIKIRWANNFYEEIRNISKEIFKGAYINCPDRNLCEWPTEYYGKNLKKLISIKKKYDPYKIFNFPQGLSQLY
jgi:hypothetical protein